MGVPRHYIKLIGNLQEYATQVDPSVPNWQEAVFSDVTEGGTKLIIECLQPNERGLRVGLCGDKYYCEAGVDRDRDDCLFVFKVESATRRQPKSIPRTYPAQLFLITSRTSNSLDRISVLWADGSKEQSPETRPAQDTFESRPSQEVRALLGAADKEVRAGWRPNVLKGEPESAISFIEKVSRCWFKFELQRYKTLTPRQESLLKNLAPRSPLGANERQRLLAVFDVSVLNSYVRDNSSRPDSFYDLLRALGALQVSSTLRAALWSAMSRDLSLDDFLRELYETAGACELLDLTEDAEAWVKEITQLLSFRAATPANQLLQRLVEDFKDQQYPLSFLHRWATENLRFDDSRPEQTPPSSAVSQASEPIASADKIAHALPPTSDRIVPDDALNARKRSPEFEDWVLSLQALESKQTGNVPNEVQKQLSTILDRAANCSRASDLAELFRLLEGLRTQVPDWTSRLPEPSRWAKDYEAAGIAYDRAFAVVAGSLDQLLAGSRFTPSDLDEAAGLLQREDMINAMPAWVWGDTPLQDDRDDNHKFAAFRRLIVPQIRERVISILSCIGEVGNYDASLLAILPPPPSIDGADVTAGMLDQHVKSWFIGIGNLLNELPDRVKVGLRNSPGGSTVHARLRQAVGLYRKLKPRVPEAVCEEILEVIVNSADESAAVRISQLYVEAVEFCEENFGSAAITTFAQLQGRVNKRGLQAPALMEGDSQGNLDIRVEHNWIDAQGGKVPLLFVPTGDETRPYGHVSVPLVLIARQRRACGLKLEYEVKTIHRDHWPRDWENPDPTELSIPEDKWRDDPDQPGQYLHTVRVRLPIRRQGRGERFEFQVTLIDSESARQIGKPNKFSWEFMRDVQLTAILPAWPEVIDPENVERHPIGPQKKSREILSRLNQNGSFCVIAPRRFGKSTLVQFLQTRAKDLGFVAPPSLVCTNYYIGAQGIDYVKFWQDLSDHLQLELGAAIVRPWESGIPLEGAFDHVRRAAQAKGKKGIVVLLDEAQIFFPTKAGISLGDILKDRLERHWSQRKADMVPLMFGFIGLPTLQARAGVNLTGLLRPLAQNDLEENELNSLILSVTSNVLNTTREARRRLARTAGNIYILRTLVDRLAEHVQGDRRMWANLDDVVKVETALRTSLREGQERIVPSYIRDILNDAEDVSEWKPNAAMPLAVAVADAKRKDASATRLFEEARLQLSSWYDSMSEGDSTRLSYDDQQFADHLRILEDRGILRNREFTSCLLEDWLLGYRIHADDREWRELLRSAAIKRIKLPALRVKVTDTEGSEASVWTVIRDQQKLAYRITQLRTEEDKSRFAETRNILEHLRTCIREGSAGSQFIFRIEDVGLSSDNDSEAVQIYRWIEGVDLSRRVGEFKSEYVADLGGKLAHALHFLHSSNIVHRDISPRNIILAEQGGDPVIIDFGFARRLNPDVKSRFDTDYSAPEVRRLNAKWTKAADVYSLGATLSKVLDPNDTSGPIRDVIEACMRDEAENRPDAARLVTMFEDAIRVLHVDTRKAQVWDSVQKIMEREASDFSWLRGLTEKHRGNFIGVALGCYPLQFDRCREAANFLNQVLEATSPKGETLSLAVAKDRNSISGDVLATEPIRFMHSLRNYHSHGDNVGRQKVLGKFRNPNDEQMLELGTAAASQIAKYIDSGSILQLTQCLLVGQRR